MNDRIKNLILNAIPNADVCIDCGFGPLKKFKVIIQNPTTKEEYYICKKRIDDNYNIIQSN